ncbi:MAG: hypothetical protein V4813_07620 [Gemmatimonadota bacterium]
MPHRKPTLPGTQAFNAPSKAHVVVGLIHLVLGVITVLGVVAALFASGLGAPLGPLTALLAVMAALRVFGGLWLADGKRRGAMLALTADILQLGAQLVNYRTASVLGLLESVVLAGAVLWVMPHLEIGKPAVERQRS